MALLPEVSQWEPGTYQIETTDDVIGGVNGISNIQGKQLGNRTRYLYDRLRDSGLNYAADTGALNAYVANVPAAPTAWVDGAEYRFKAANTNNGAATFTPNNAAGGLPPVPIYAGDNAALQGGEIVAGGSVTVRFVQALNSGSGGVVIIRSTGGVMRAGTPSVGDISSAVATMSAVNAATDGMATVSVAGGTDVTLTPAQYGNAQLKLTGTPTAGINLVFPNTPGQWIIKNAQGGAQNITAKTTTAGGATVVIPQGVAVVVSSDGTDIVLASASGTSAFRIVSITGVTGTTLSVSGGYTPGALFLGKNGGLLQPGDYSATNGSTIALTTAAVSTDKFDAYVFSSFTVANAVQKSGDTMTGPLGLAAGSTGVTQAYSDNSTNLATTANVQSAIANSRDNVPQSVLYGKADANGYAAFLAAGSGLSCNLDATTPLLLSFAAGYSAKGLTSYLAQIAASITGAWTGLTANATLYLYVERNASTGALTYGFSALQPLYQDATPPSPANGQHWFSPAAMVMQYYNGSAWVSVQRLFVGRAVTGASTITTLNSFAFKGRYLSQQFALAYSASSALTHALGVQPRVTAAYLVNVVSELGYGVGNRVLMPYADNTSAVCSLSSDPMIGSFNLSSGGIALPQIGTGTRAGITAANWNVQTYFDRGW